MDHNTSRREESASLSDLLIVKDGTRKQVTLNSLHQGIGAMLAVSWSDSHLLLGSSNFGICMYLPSAFWPAFQQSSLARVRVSQGTFIHNGRYFKELQSASDTCLPFSCVLPDYITPDTRLDLTISSPAYECRFSVREKIESLVITLKIVDPLGRQRTVKIGYAVRKAAGASQIGPCLHPRQTSLDEQFENRRIVRASLVDVGSVLAAITLVPVGEDLEACVYACDPPQAHVVIASGCCVNCALKSQELQKYDDWHQSLIIMFNGP